MKPTTDIIIAEDDENDRFIVSRAFENNPHNVSLAFACDGKEVIEHLQRLPGGNSAKLLVLDLKMPRMDGFQVLEWLSNHPNNRPARIVVLSSSADPSDSERSRQLGADLHLTKPHDSREYVRIVMSLLAQLPEPAVGQSSRLVTATGSP